MGKLIGKCSFGTYCAPCLLFNSWRNAFWSDNCLKPKKLVVNENSVLHMKLDGDIGDYTYANFNANSFAIQKKFGLYEILEGLKIAKEDKNIEGIFLNCDNINAGMATVKEIRDGLADFLKRAENS